MKPDSSTWTLTDLCDAAGVTSRTVRYYISQGLLRSPSGAGPVARYDDGHLARLRLIRRLQREHLPLAEIRRRLAALSDQEAIDLQDQPASAPEENALDYIRAALSTRGVSSLAKAAPSPRAAPAFSPAPATPAQPPPYPTIGAAPPAMQPLHRTMEVPASYADASEEAPDRSQWERITLDQDVELHVRRPLSRPQSRAVDRLIQVARRILKEDLP